MPSYSVNALENAAWLVYINGLEIPSLGFTVNYGVWEMSRLSLDLIPHYLINRIGSEDRLQIAVFYLDHHWNPKSPTFCLLGEFEVVGQSYTNTAHGRTLRLNAVSQLQIFNQLNFYYISSLNDVVTSSSPSKAQDAGSIRVPKPLYPASLFIEGLTSPSTVPSETTSAETSVASDNYIKRPIDFVTNIFRALLRPLSTKSGDTTSVEDGSRELPRSANCIPGKNFFARWLTMTGFHRRWAALPVLEDLGETGCFPLVKAVQDTQVLPALENQIGAGVGNAGTAWELLHKVLSYMFMEIVTIPAPSTPVVNRETGVISATANNAEKMIASFFVKPQCFFALPPTCNVVFPSMVTSFDSKEDYLPQPTRIYLGESFMSNVLNQTKTASYASLIQETLTTGYPPQVKKRMLDLVSSPESNNKNFLIHPEEFFKGPITRRLNAPPWMYLLQLREKAQPVVSTKETVKDAVDAVKDTVDAATSDLESVATARTSLGALFDKYAEYEFWRARYAERSGAVNMAWNPYIVPGLPVAIFDERLSSIDIMAYPLSVTHHASAGRVPSMTTSMSVSFIRSMPEFIGQLGAAADTNTEEEAYDIAPPEPIESIREAFQRTEEASTVYTRMLYEDRDLNRSTAFDWRNIMDVKDVDGNTVDTEDEAWKLREDVSLTPKDGYQVLFNSRSAAMQYASRPVCTLKEYVEIWHGQSVNELLESRELRGEYKSYYSPSSDQDGSKGAVFWGRIYKLDQGPGDMPAVEVSNVGGAPEYAAAGDGQTVTVDSSTGMPETRKDWDTILEKYRKIIRSEFGNISPQQ